MTTLLAFRTIKDAETASTQLATQTRSSSEYVQGYETLTTAVAILEEAAFTDMDAAKQTLRGLRSKCFTLSPSITISDLSRRQEALSETTELLASLRRCL